jgi:hypothetical protein
VRRPHLLRRNSEPISIRAPASALKGSAARCSGCSASCPVSSRAAVSGAERQTPSLVGGGHPVRSWLGRKPGSDRHGPSLTPHPAGDAHASSIARSSAGARVFARSACPRRAVVVEGGDALRVAARVREGGHHRSARRAVTVRGTRSAWGRAPSGSPRPRRSRGAPLPGRGAGPGSTRRRPGSMPR